MASTTAANASASPDTSVTVKVAFDGSNRKFKLALKDLGATVFPEKIRSLLQVPSSQTLTLERFSDSSASFITLDSGNPPTYKQLYRAAKAKLKLRIRATAHDPTPAIPAEEAEKKVEKPVEPTATVKPSIATLPLRTVMAQPVVPGPAPDNFARTRQDLFNHLSRARNFSRVTNDAPNEIPVSSWQVFCNVCDKPMADAHFHCSTCDDGDYDLCESCVNNGKLCPGEGHWLIKRFIQNGKVINSTTERIAPKPKPQPQADREKEKAKEMPGAFNSEIKLEPAAPEVEPSRTCNCCVRILPEKLTVTCLDCDDYDICMACHVDNKHGHHPAHTFKPTSSEVQPSTHVASLCAPGRNRRHSAICDGCDKSIFGVRHKCLDCPDWDYCGDCFDGARSSHPGHRFVPVYDPLNAPRSGSGMHYGIYCDGPLCKDKPNQRYVEGVRYKCAICHDTDFCANCEAHPSNKHNVTHPLIKFKTQVRNVSVTTVGENKEGEPLSAMGDRQISRELSIATLPPYSLRDTQAGVKVQEEEPKAEGKSAQVAISELDAHFVTDTVTDGSILLPDTTFTQTWTLRNPGSTAWPVGCSVRNVGGDNMLNIDRNHPTSVAALAEAQESNLSTVPVLSNDNYSFSVKMRSPSREGRHISYWRLKAADGTPFGHKLWCDIEVKNLPTLTPTTQAFLADNQMQLMLLEHQNKKRMLAARQTCMDQYLTSPKLGESSKAAVETALEPAEDVTASAMVFPKLDKESPASSTYADAGTSITPAARETGTAATQTELETAEEVFEDVQSIDSGDDEGFLTDDEYDILCASDEEAAVNGNGARA